MRGRSPLDGSRDSFVVFAFIAFSSAAMIGFGEYTPFCLALVLLGIAASMGAMAARAARPAPRWLWQVAVVIAAALALGDIGHLSGANARALGVAIGAALVAVVAAGRIRIVALVLAFETVVATTLNSWTWGRAPIDVFVFLQTASQRLLHGLNPYGIAIPQTAYTGYVGPAAIPFVYGPGAALLDAPGRALGDVRVVHALAAVVLILAVASLSRRRAPHEGWAIASLAVLFPLLPAMVLFAWVDLLAMALFAVWVALRRSHPRWAAFALGFSLATKPSAVVALLVAALWLPRVRRELAGAVVVAAMIVVPFLLMTGAGAFWQDVVVNLAAQPPRLDSLTLDAFLHAQSFALLPGWLAAVIVGAAAVLVLARRPAGLAGVLIAGAFLTSVALLVAKVAYLNYWFIPAVLLLLALAVGDAEPEPVALPWSRAPQWVR